MTDQNTLVPRLVTGLFATYFSQENGETLVRTGNRGEIVKVSPAEAERLDGLGSVTTIDNADADAAERQTALARYRAQRGDADAVAAVERAVAPTDYDPAPTNVQAHVSPPPLGEAPRGDVVTGDTGGPDTPAPVAAGSLTIVRADAPDVAESSVADLASWIEDERPNVTDTVGLAESDPEFAAKVLEAENSATGGDPRKGVVDGLTKIIDA